jgi:hypothetical protein
MERPCRSSWVGSHESFQAEEYDAGASPTHQASQHGSRKTAGQASTNFENTLGLLRKSLMKPFMKAHFVYCNGP